MHTHSPVHNKKRAVYFVSTYSKWRYKHCRDKTRMRARVLFKGSSELRQLLYSLVDPHTVLLDGGGGAIITTSSITISTHLHTCSVPLPLWSFLANLARSGMALRCSSHSPCRSCTSDTKTSTTSRRSSEEVYAHISQTVLYH